jgi:hypothetical protein
VDNFYEIILPLYGVMIFLMVPIAFLTRNRKSIVEAHRVFLKGILAIINSCNDIDECARQTQTLYRHISEQYSSVDEKFRSPASLLENLIITMDTLTPTAFEEKMKAEPPTDARQRLLEIQKVLNKNQPFSSLSVKQGNLLRGHTKITFRL